MATIRNGVNLDNIQQLIGAIEENPDLAKVKFMASSTWKNGTKTEVKVSELQAGGQNIAGEGREFTVMVDEPPQLGGTDEAPNPVELIAAGLCGCITAGIATNSALFETDLSQIDVQVEVNFDIRGVLGLDSAVPDGALDIHYSVNLKGDGTEEALMKSKETIDKKSPIRNTLEKPLSITTRGTVATSTPVAEGS